MFTLSGIRMEKTFNVKTGEFTFEDGGREIWERESPALKAQLLEMGEPLLRSFLGDEVFHDAVALLPVPRASIMESWQTSRLDNVPGTPFAPPVHKKSWSRRNKPKKR
jgi:hypothetical protein